MFIWNERWTKPEFGSPTGFKPMTSQITSDLSYRDFYRAGKFNRFARADLGKFLGVVQKVETITCLTLVEQTPALWAEARGYPQKNKQTNKQTTVDHDFSNLQGKRKLVRVFGMFEKSRVKVSRLTKEGKRILARVIGKFKKLKVREIGIQPSYTPIYSWLPTYGINYLLSLNPRVP